MNIMIVDDEEITRVLVRSLIKSAGHRCRCYSSGEEALDHYFDEPTDVVILDVLMPEMNGFEVCRKLRQLDSCVPILFLTVKSDIEAKRQGFASGGDDYLVKPFNEDELILRIEALYKRNQRGNDLGSAHETDYFSIGEFVFNSRRHQVLKKGKEVDLTPREYLLLYELAIHNGEVLSKQGLIELVWGKEYLTESINIAVYIRNIRKKIEDDPSQPRYLKTAWGVGYYFDGNSQK